MATFEEAKNSNDVFLCDRCKEKIRAQDIVLQDPADNLHLAPMTPFLYINKEGMITGGSEQPSKEKGDKLLACPHCRTAHLFGFDMA